MNETTTIKGKLARELDSLRVRVRRDGITAEELNIELEKARDIARRACQKQRRTINNDVSGYIDAGNIFNAARETEREIENLITSSGK